jgi:ribosomal protein S24E
MSGRGGPTASWSAWRRCDTKIEMTSTRANPLIKRREVAFEIEEAATPRRVDVRRELAVMLKADLDRVWVRRMETKTGTHRTLGLAHVYDDASQALGVEPKHIIERNRSPQESAEGAKKEE